MADVARIKTATGTQAKVQRTARASRQRPRRSLLGFYGVGLCFVLLGLLHVWFRLQVVHMGYALSTTTQLQNQLEQENRELKLELASLTSPDRLEMMARKRLGLVSPEKGQVIVLP
jgi:cell division protein FtsL